MNVVVFSKTQFIAIKPAQRKRIEALIEDLVSLLDFIDGDEDREDGADDEPELGWPDSRLAGFGPWTLEPRACRRRLDECEVENEHGGDILDEPHDAIDEDTGVADEDGIWEQKKA